MTESLVARWRLEGKLLLFYSELLQQLLAWRCWITWALCFSPSCLDDKAILHCCFSLLLLSHFSPDSSRSFLSGECGTDSCSDSSSVCVMTMTDICLFHYTLFRARCAFHLLCRGQPTAKASSVQKSESSQWTLHQYFQLLNEKLNHVKEQRTHSVMVHTLCWRNPNIQYYINNTVPHR